MRMKNSEFKPVKLCLKIDLVSYPARAERLVNIYIFFHVCFSSLFSSAIYLSIYQS